MAEPWQKVLETELPRCTTGTRIHKWPADWLYGLFSVVFLWFLLSHIHTNRCRERERELECVCVRLRMHERGEAEKINSKWLAFAVEQESSGITNESGFCMLDLTLNGFATRRYHLWQFHGEGQRLASILPIGNVILHRQISLMYTSLIALSRWPPFFSYYAVIKEGKHLERVQIAYLIPPEHWIWTMLHGSGYVMGAC